jgi:hypothetical protein
MNQATTRNTADVVDQNAIRQPVLPRRSRIGSAIASAVVSGVLFGSVVLGMTSMGETGRHVVAQASASAPA